MPNVCVTRLYVTATATCCSSFWIELGSGIELALEVIILLKGILEFTTRFQSWSFPTEKMKRMSKNDVVCLPIPYLTHSQMSWSNQSFWLGHDKWYWPRSEMGNNFSTTLGSETKKVSSFNYQNGKSPNWSTLGSALWLILVQSFPIIAIQRQQFYHFTWARWMTPSK